MDALQQIDHEGISHYIDCQVAEAASHHFSPLVSIVLLLVIFICMNVLVWGGGWIAYRLTKRQGARDC